MELWIRSQGKGKLIKVEALRVQDDNMVANERDIIGTYTSEKRLKEILDEIQNVMKGDKITKILNRTNGNMNNVYPIYVYEMPEE